MTSCFSLFHTIYNTLHIISVVHSLNWNQCQAISCVYNGCEHSDCPSVQYGEGSMDKQMVSRQCESWCAREELRPCWWSIHKMGTCTPTCWCDHYYPRHYLQHCGQPQPFLKGCQHWCQSSGQHCCQPSHPWRWCQPSCPTPTGEKQPGFRATDLRHTTALPKYTIHLDVKLARTLKQHTSVSGNCARNWTKYCTRIISRDSTEISAQIVQ